MLSLFLTSRFVHDPPAFQEERKSVRVNGKLNVDGLGIALIGLGSGALEVLLDRGQIDDWFGSRFICWCFAVAVVCLSGAVLWELRQSDPLVDFRLLKTRNFCIACIFYFIFGVGLFGTTTMIPQMLQSLYGYRAIDAGLVLGPGALVITLLAPVGAQLVERRIVHPRVLIFGSLIVIGISMVHYSRFNLDTDYAHYALARGLQGFGYAFFFVPLSVMTYSHIRPEQNGKAAALTNFFRNWGGSFGIAFVTTLSERRSSFHQSRVGGHLTGSSPILQDGVHRTASYLQAHGFSPVDALNAAYGRYYSMLGAQTRLLAFMDCFFVMGVITFLVVPLVLITKNFKAGGGSSPSH